jgi:hypothetical protein
MIRDYPDSNVAGPSSSTQPINGNTLFTRLNQDMVPNEITYGASIEATSPLHTRQGRPLETEKLGPLVTLDVKGNELRVSDYFFGMPPPLSNLIILGRGNIYRSSTKTEQDVESFEPQRQQDRRDRSTEHCSSISEDRLAVRTARQLRLFSF